MNLSDLFKSVFGFRDSCNGCSPRDNFHDFEEEGEPNEDPGGFNDVFKHFHHDMTDMFRELADVQRQMEDMFRNSGSIDFPPAIEGPDRKIPGNPRDHMLKEPDSFDGPPNDQMPRISPPNRPPPHGPEFSQPPVFFGRFLPPSWKKPDFKDYQDKDMDGEAKIDDIVDLFKSPNLPVPSGPSHVPSASPEPFRGISRSFSSGWSSRTIRGADGKFEQKVTVRDSDGNEETTITRSIGDQSHSTVIKKDSTGIKEKIENFNNMDQSDLSKFNEKWNNNKKSIDTDDTRDKMLMPSKPDVEDQSIFKKLFGL